jgi:hypothetical protein
MTNKAFFERLGAPLANPRWSWGAERKEDGTVFLRVWKDECERIDGKFFMRLTANEYFEKNDPANLGYQERLRHIELVENGAMAYMIICRAKDVNAIPRSVRGYDKEVFLGGLLIDRNGDKWLELNGRFPIKGVQKIMSDSPK